MGLKKNFFKWVDNLDRFCYNRAMEREEDMCMITFTEYGMEETTIVYLVNYHTREELSSMPILFKGNRAIMGQIMKETVQSNK